MSVAVSIEEPATVIALPEHSSRRQPYQCQVCGSRFTRNENLKRHAAVHSRSGAETSLPCEFCQTTFSRRDLRFRHMKRKHPEQLNRRSGSRHDEVFQQGGRGVQEGDSNLPMASENTLSQSQPHMLMHSMGDSDSVGTYSWNSQPVLAQGYQSIQNGPPATAYVAMISVPTLNEEAPQSFATGRLSQAPTTQHFNVDPFSHETDSYDSALLSEPSSFGSRYQVDRNIHVNPQPISPEAFPTAGSPSPYIPDGLSPKDVTYMRDEWFPSSTQVGRGYSLYFNHVSQFVPFIHRPTFDAAETPRHLGLAMLCLAYQHGEDPDADDEEGSGARLSQRCFHRVRVVAAAEEERVDDLAQTTSLVQAYWLLQVYVMMYLCGPDSAYGHKIHSRMISLTRFGGLTAPMPSQTTATEDLDDLWHNFIKSESHKRTLLAVHQIDALWYQLFSIPRSLSHLEIKHDLPCREDCWTAISSSVWAHRQLAARQATPLVPYSEAVRVFLSPNPDIASLPAFDLYGAKNIAQFLLSSAREVSGWSTMTGRLSMERFEPLQSSLLAMQTLIRPNGQTAKSTHAASVEATWEMAMLELLLWSPLHTSGIVGGSVDSFLTQSTYLAVGEYQIPNEASVRNAVQPHIDWFLKHLNTTNDSDAEPPWVILYAYKAFLIAWQMLRGGLMGAMTVVGVNDGDVKDAVVWARRVFKRKHRRQLSRLIDECLDILDG